ncbi:MAG: ABC transporter substrate-binding protein [Candidatus Pacearchaeota archaeon]
MAKKVLTWLIPLIIVAIIIIAVLAFTIWKPVKEEKEEVIKIGVAIPLSGNAANLGNEELEGIHLAIQEIGGKINNKEIKLIVEDTKNDPKEGLTAVKKLVEYDKVNYILGAMSSVGLAVKPYIEEKRIPSLWVGANPDLTKNTAFMFRNMATSQQNVDAIVNEVTNKKMSKIALFYINDDFGVGIKELIIKEITPVSIEPFSKEGSDFRTEITKALSKSPDGVIVIGYGQATGFLIKQLRELKYEGLIIGSTEISGNEVKNIAGEAIKNSFYPDYPYSPEFEAALGKTPTPDIIVGYVETVLLLNAIKNTDGSPEAVRDYLANIKDLPTKNGPISVINQEVQYDLVMKEIK